MLTRFKTFIDKVNHYLMPNEVSSISPVIEEKIDELALLKKKLVNEIEDTIPQDFIDSFTEELIQEPVLTEMGHVFERSSVERWIEDRGNCPLTRERLTKEELIAAPGIEQVLTEFKTVLNSMFKEIDALKMLDEEILAQKSGKYKLVIEMYSYMFTAEKNVLTQCHIQTIKDESHLNINKIADLQYWGEQDQCLNLGLIKVTCGTHSFYLAPSIYEVLIAADKSYSRITDFRRALQVAQGKKMSCWANFWGNTSHTQQMLHQDFSNKHQSHRLSK